MSFFLITNSEIKSKKASVLWSKLYKNCHSTELGKTLKLVYSNNFDKKKIFIEETPNSKIIGVGTWFSEDGFFGESIPTEELEKFSQQTTKKLFGHYCFIIFDKKTNDLRIVTDPGGLINIYTSTEDNDIYISNDPKIIADLRDAVSLSKNGIHEFVNKENTIGTGTVFSEVKRLKLGCEILLKDNSFKENKFHTYEPHKLTEEEYLSKVNRYFRAISNYKGIIATELSAGYDTRLIAACASKTIPNLLAITNDNKSDQGVDLETSRVIANRLKLRLEEIIRPDKLPMKPRVMLHSFGIGRNIIRSVAMPYTNKVKYQNADLILGGYGGEVLRGKYCNFSGVEEFAKNFYEGEQLLEWGFTDSYENMKKKLDEGYSQDWITDSDQLSNWLYLMDRMRIWGGSAVLGKLIYGDRLHPFMDWQLAGPILRMHVNELKDAKVLRGIVKHFAPEISDIPINALHPIFLKNINYIQHITYSLFWGSIRFKNRLFNYFGLFKSAENKRILNSYSDKKNLKTFNSISGFDTKLISTIREPNVISRYISIEILYRLLK